MLQFDQTKCTHCNQCLSACPFGAIENRNGQLSVGAACKLCRACVKACPEGAISIASAKPSAHVRKEDYRGILVYVEHTEGTIHPVTYELIGKAQELCKVTKEKVSCLLIGKDITAPAHELLRYGVDTVYVYDNEAFAFFRADIFANAFEDCVKKHKPSAVLVGATYTGRSLAPRVAARLKTGLTADCTSLQMRANSDLVQIRPAFGGNIMAQIVTPRHRPQMATVRYKVMRAARPDCEQSGAVVFETLSKNLLSSGIRLLHIKERAPCPDITSAEVLVVAGRGVHNQAGMALVEEFAGLLGAQMAFTRPMVEARWGDYTQQVGLSGRTVKPRLLVAFGVSGAVQFTAGMESSDCIFAVNQDPDAPIFHKAHYAVVGDLYQILPELIGRIRFYRNGRESLAL